MVPNALFADVRHKTLVSNNCSEVNSFPFLYVLLNTKIKIRGIYCDFVQFLQRNKCREMRDKNEICLKILYKFLFFCLSGTKIRENFAFYANLIYVFIARIRINFPMNAMNAMFCKTNTASFASPVLPLTAIPLIANSSGKSILDLIPK